VLPLALFISIYVLGEWESVSDMFARLRSQYYITELINLTIPDGQDWESWKQQLKMAFADGVISELDGLSVYYPDWKFSMRSSNTEPVVRFILETRGSDTREEKVDLIKSVIGVS